MFVKVKNIEITFKDGDEGNSQEQSTYEFENHILHLWVFITRYTFTIMY